MLESSVSTEGVAIATPSVFENQIPRGVTPAILLEQVRNTVPFLFHPDSLAQSPFASRLREATLNPGAELSHEAYFELCVCAHYATVASFVPTDVDNQIRFRLWHPRLPIEVLETMANLVLRARAWDVTGITTRGVSHPNVPGLLSGHDGEWFSIAVGAYAILRKRSPELSQTVLKAIFDELEREAQILLSFKGSRDGINLLKSATIISHNLGDLDRVMEMWGLSEPDPLYGQAFKLGHENGNIGKSDRDHQRALKFGMKANDRYREVFQFAGQLNKTMMVDENHRHFALRSPKCLRRAVELQIPIGPFFDQWGSDLVKSSLLSVTEIAEVAEALIDGWVWLSQQKGGGPNVPTGYARALAGIIESFPGGLNGLANELPSRVAKTLKTGVLRSQCAISRPQFEEKWAHTALKFAARGLGKA